MDRHDSLFRVRIKRIWTGNGGLTAKVQAREFSSGGTPRAQQQEGPRQADFALRAELRCKGRFGFLDDRAAGCLVGSLLVEEAAGRAEGPGVLGLARCRFADHMKP